MPPSAFCSQNFLSHFCAFDSHISNIHPIPFHTSYWTFPLEYHFCFRITISKLITLPTFPKQHWSPNSLFMPSLSRLETSDCTLTCHFPPFPLHWLHCLCLTCSSLRYSSSWLPRLLIRSRFHYDLLKEAFPILPV